MEINERFIKVSSRLPYDKDIPLGADVTLTIDGKSYIVNCVKREELDQQQDELVDHVFVLKYAGE